MRISPVSMNYVSNPTPQFKGRNSGAKWGAVIFGSIATISAVGGSIILSGGLAAIPWIAAYTGIGAGAGAMIGHSIDKGARNFDKNA